MPDQKREKGVTLIELIAALLIIAIVSAVAFERVQSTAAVEIKAQAEAMKSHIRYVQIRAMNMTSAVTTPSICNAAFGISAASNPYFMFRDCNTGNKVTLPGASDNTILLSNVTLTATNVGTDNVITFDDWGRPCTDLQGNTPATLDITLTLSHPSVSQPETITITRNTGLVP